MEYEVYYCTACKHQQDHYVTHQVDSIGRKLIMGRCTHCALKRALPQNNLEANDTVIHFSKYKGKRLGDIDSNFLVWLVCKQIGGHSFQERVKSVLDKRMVKY